jgi:hypothetical protein
VCRCRRLGFRAPTRVWSHRRRTDAFGLATGLSSLRTLALKSQQRPQSRHRRRAMPLELVVDEDEGPGDLRWQ